jgi:hypothetical protein
MKQSPNAPVRSVIRELRSYDDGKFRETYAYVLQEYFESADPSNEMVQWELGYVRSRTIGAEEAFIVQLDRRTEFKIVQREAERRKL